MSLSLPAAKGLVKIINTPDDTQYVCQVYALCNAQRKGEVTSRVCCDLITSKTEGCLEALLDLAMTHQLPLHNDIKKSELKIGEVIGKGAKCCLCTDRISRQSWTGSSGHVSRKSCCDQVLQQQRQNRRQGVPEGAFYYEVSNCFVRLTDEASVIRCERFVLICYGGSAKKGNKFIVTELMEVCLQLGT